MFETLETRQFLSSTPTPTADAPTTDTASATVEAKATLHVRKAGRDPVEYVEIKLKEVLITG